MLLREIANVDVPGYIYGDNEASIFLAKNKQVSNRTKHIDIREHYIRDCIEEGHIKLKRVNSENNVSDILTKNKSVKEFGENRDGILNGDILHSASVITIEDQNHVQRENVWCNKCSAKFVHDFYECKMREDNSNSKIIRAHNMTNNEKRDYKDLH